MNKSLKLVLIAAMSTAFVASAHNVTNILVDSSGHAVKGDFGQCIESEFNSNNEDCMTRVDINFSIAAHTLFDFNKSNLRPEGKAELNALARKIIEARDIGRIKEVDQITLVGHTDGVGSQKFNLGLSERRANSVADYMVQKGVPANIISTSGVGKLQPVATNKTKEGRQQNRRVDVKISGIATKEKNN